MRTSIPTKRPYIGPTPKFWRPKLAATQCLDAKIIHWDLIGRFTDGSATTGDLWDWIETGYTYSQIMRLQTEDGTEFTPEAVAAMSEQLDIYASVIARFRTTGRVGFSGPELCVAKAAAHIMDGLIDIDRHGIAVKAAYWSLVQMDRIRALGGKAMRAAA
ncbi:hypothetical protein [Rhodoferax ferrireducens]|uniref:hypothetical protein n=1 Tax=Rhodoferax ferrireducens TaxID=192843 RepID=UPI000E0D7C61|nr:hypothetical protein [Rhodoferax ferrireducens]